ncbi:FMN-binding glutamate synthase family protein [Pseudomonas putida]|nr:FMN-binding glutamate synthase family protein [Pseudomonas putida]
MFNAIQRQWALILSVALLFISLYAICLHQVTPWLALPWAALVFIGALDLSQKEHAVRRNYPIIGNMRYLLEAVRPELRQYFFEGDHEELPFSRSERSMVYRRARNIPAEKSFGTLDNLYSAQHEFISHSMMPIHVDPKALRVAIGGPDCLQPYSASLMNVSAMSFGSLSANAVMALGRGAKRGGFAIDTGEGGCSKYHLSEGADVIWEIGSGYFGCRNDDGSFNPDRFASTAKNKSVVGILLKLSQGAKAGKGGILPGHKVSMEIAIARGVRQGEDCISPAAHTAFSGPVGMMNFIKQMRDLSGGKPVGVKLCIGRPSEAATMVKAMLFTNIYPDFIVIDGSEGGTGAAPEEFSDHIGMPMRDGLVLMHNLLRGAGIRDRIKIGCSGKIISGFDILRALALGADYCNLARGFMFSLGCIQSQSCGSNKCPTGVATQDPSRQRALDVEERSHRVTNYHKNTMSSVADILGAAGINSSDKLTAERIQKRVSDSKIVSYANLYPFLHHGELLEGHSAHTEYRELWANARHDSFN